MRSGAVAFGFNAAATKTNASPFERDLAVVAMMAWICLGSGVDYDAAMSLSELEVENHRNCRRRCRCQLTMVLRAHPITTIAPFVIDADPKHIHAIMRDDSEVNAQGDALRFWPAALNRKHCAAAHRRRRCDPAAPRSQQNWQIVHYRRSNHAGGADTAGWRDPVPGRRFPISSRTNSIT